MRQRGPRPAGFCRALLLAAIAGSLLPPCTHQAQAQEQAARQTAQSQNQAQNQAQSKTYPPATELPTTHERDQAQQAYVEGGKAVAQKDLARAVDRFARAAELDPANPIYTSALEIARQNRITQLLEQAQKARIEGDDSQWRARLTEAVRLDAQCSSHNPMVAAHRDDLAESAAREREAQQARVLGGPAADAAPPVELAPRALGPQSFHLDAPRDQVIRKVYQAYGITPFLDKSVSAGTPEDTRVRFDQDDVSFAQAEEALELATNTFAVPLDPERVLIALDSKENRSRYERQAEETIYLPGLTQTDMSDVTSIAKTIFDAQQTNVDEGAHTLLLRAPESKMKPFNLLLTELLAGRGEVLLDVHLYEVSRTSDVSEGAELPASSNIFNVTSEVDSLIAANPSLVQEIISSGLATPGNYEEIAAALILSGQAGSTLLSQPFAYFGGGITTTGVTLGQSAANASLTISDTRVLDQIQLRVLDQEEGSVKVGERYPIVTSSYSNLATTSTSLAGINSAGLSSTLASLGISAASLQASASATVPQVQYEDLGLKLTATPRIHEEHDVTLKLDLELSSLNGSSLNGNPVLNNRQYQSIITLKPGEKALLVSSLNTQESAALTGLPFLSEIPGFRFGTNETKNKTFDSLVIVITPHLVRLGHRSASGPLVMLPPHS